MKKFSSFIAILSIILFSTNLSATLLPSIPAQNWWSPASPENGGNGISIDNQTTTEITLTTTNKEGRQISKLTVKPRSYGEYFSSNIFWEYGHNGFTNSNLPLDDLLKQLL